MSVKDQTMPECKTCRDIYIDAGVEHINIKTYDSSHRNNSKTLTNEIMIANNDDLQSTFRKSGATELFSNLKDEKNDGNTEIYISGKLSEITQEFLQEGVQIMPAAALWAAAKSILHRDENKGIESIGIIDLSASGYMVICINKNEELKDDVLVVNPRCGAGSGVNLCRALEKLNIDKEKVDHLLSDYIGNIGEEKRKEIPVRSDRCGVFSSSATISDKNQGIPLDYALAVTMKSEVQKPCNKISNGTEKIYLTGGVFRWQFARDCASDILEEHGVKKVIYDKDQSIILTGMKYLIENIGEGGFRKQNNTQLRQTAGLVEYPSFQTLYNAYIGKGLYTRLPDPEIPSLDEDKFTSMPVNLALDIGSTMAKMVVADSVTGELLFKNSYNNHGDTIETIKHIFRGLRSININRLNIQNIGITGSGRYQVQKALKASYPHLKERVFALVENYAHARGSIQYAKDHIAKIKEEGQSVNQDFCLLIDIGGEDTKISVISLKKEELFDNAMNIKCSAGTGSLMDTLKVLFDIDDVAEAYDRANKAGRVFGINATCAVFLMENARKMQAEGYAKDEILASCCYAIVENMARSLWDQVEFPKNAVALLHGQTMLSDPLPLAVTSRIQEHTSSRTFCLVPPLPGHRACIGLIKGAQNKNSIIEDYCHLDDFIEREFDRKIIQCRGAACGDKNARCSRTRLTSTDASKISLTLGGCTAVNELQARKETGEKIKVSNAYRDIWEFIDNRLPKSESDMRLVIPRSFAVSEHALFLAKIFEYYNIPVHIDNVREKDILKGQPFFAIDTCAPNIGATGQFVRLGGENHGIILAPQIDFLPAHDVSLGRTCTTNQGGVFIALHFSRMANPDARFKTFSLSLNKHDPEYIAHQLHKELKSIFKIYGVETDMDGFTKAIRNAADEHNRLQEEIADMAAEYIEEAIAKKINISIVCAREYILNPGIFDSHVGKLLKDKGVIALPAYVFDTILDEQFSFMYWRNPHDILSKANAIQNKQFHQIIRHKRLKELIKKIESGGTGSLLSIVTVSTFRCGPDSVTLPQLSEITKNIPSLLIQSDAMIAELAHLENRVNTHLNQLEKKLHNELGRAEERNYKVELINEFSLDTLNKETDVIYFPTLGDNRMVTSVFRAAGITVFDNFDDDTYDLEEKAKAGRKYVGDSVCVPMAAVFSDMMDAINDFDDRKKAGDPLIKGKERIVLFMHGGDGPCRLGQYVSIYKLIFHRLFGNSSEQHNLLQPPVKILENLSTSLLGQGDYSSELEEWIAFQAFQALVAKGLFHSLYLKAASICKNHHEYEEMRNDYLSLKRNIYHRIEHHSKPSKLACFIVDSLKKKLPSLAGLAQYFGYGLYKNNGLRKIFREFSNKWIKPFVNEGENNNRIRLHIDGEIYMRIAQVEEILKSMIDSLGFNFFEASYTPMWIFFENILEARILIANKEIEMDEQSLKHSDGTNEMNVINKSIKDKKQIITDTKKTISNLRNILAKPLYKSAGLKMPHEMKKIFAAAAPVVPTFKPYGELVPYVGETLLNLREGVDLVLNVAPEGCMVSSMGEILGPRIQQLAGEKARIQYLFSTEGEINEEILRLSLLKALGPEKYYGNLNIIEDAL